MKILKILSCLIFVGLFQAVAAQVFTPPSQPKPQPRAQPQPIAAPVLARSFDVMSMVWEQGLAVRGCYIGSVYQNDENGRAKGSLRLKGPTGKIDTLGACREQSEREFDATLPPKTLPSSGSYVLNNETFTSANPLSIEFSFSQNELEGSYSTSTTFIRRVTTRVYSITGKRTACVGFLRGICYSAMMKSQGDTWRVLYGFTQNLDGSWQARGAYWNRYDEATGFARFRLEQTSGTPSDPVLPSSVSSEEPKDSANVTRAFPLSKIGGMDSYIRSSLPSALWSKETAIIVGGWGDEYRGLVWFGVNRLPAIPKGYSARLYLYERAPDDGTANRPTSMISYRAASPISSQTAWQNRPEVERDTEWEREVSGEGWLALDITSYIESWRAGAPNYGIVLVPRSTNNKFNFFVASDDSTRPSLHPYIRIELDVESAAGTGQQRQEPNPPLPSS